MDYKPPSSSVRGNSQARILEWVAIFFSRGSFWPKDQTHVSCLVGRFFTTEPPCKPRWYRRIYHCCLVTQLCPTLCNPVDCSMAVYPALHHLPELAQTRVHWVGDAIQPSCPLSFSSPAFNHSQHQGLFQWISSSHQVAKLLELQPQHRSLQWIFRTDFL